MTDAPTIAQVLDGFAAGTYSRDEAMVWLYRHIDIAVEAALDRQAFAALAMQTLMADRQFMQDARNKGQDPRQAVAVAAYEQADAMETVRTN